MIVMETATEFWERIRARIVTSADRRAIIPYLAAVGIGTNRIASELGVTRTTVYRVLRAASPGAEGIGNPEVGNA